MNSKTLLTQLSTVLNDIATKVAEFDADGDGFVTNAEFKIILSELRLKLKLVEMIHIIRHFDPDESGDVESDQMLHVRGFTFEIIHALILILIQLSQRIWLYIFLT